MKNENLNENAQAQAQELLDFLAAGKQARRVTTSDEGEHENISSAERRARRAKELAAEADAVEAKLDQPEDALPVEADAVEAIPVEADAEEKPAAVSKTVSDAVARKLSFTVSSRAKEEYDPIGDTEELFAALGAADQQDRPDPIGLDALNEDAEELPEPVPDIWPTAQPEPEEQPRRSAEKKKKKNQRAAKPAKPAAPQQETPADAPKSAAKQKAKPEKQPKDSAPKQPKIAARKPERFSDDEDEPKRRRGGWIALGAVAAVLCAAIAVGSWMVSRVDTVFPHVKIEGVQLEGLSASAAADALKDAGWDGPDGSILHVTLPGNASFDVPSSAMGWTVDAEDAAQVACEYGKDGNFLSNGVSYLRCLFSGADLTDQFAAGLDSKGLRQIVKDAVEEANEKLVDTMNVDEKKEVLQIVKGGAQLAADTSSVYEAVVSALEDHVANLECTTTSDESKIDNMDLQALHDEVCGEPVNAYYDPETKEIKDGEPGIEFDVSEAERLWKAAEIGDTVAIPVTITKPSFRASDVTELYSDLLAAKTTSLSGSSAARVTNVTLAAQKINGMILEPGDVFSYNKAVGQRTTAAGFREAGAYANGEVVQEVGGGICQVSSTLYYCTLYSNLKITARTNHYFPVGYIESGMDATVSWGAPDFQFQNDRTFPIKIVAKVEGSSLTVELWGTDVDGSYVKMDSTTSGLTTTTFRNVYDKDDQLISRTQEAVSVYHNHDTNNNNNNNTNTNTNNNTNTNTNTNPTPRPTTTPATPKPTTTPATPAPATPTPVSTPTPVEEQNTPTPIEDDAD